MASSPPGALAIRWTLRLDSPRRLAASAVVTSRRATAGDPSVAMSAAVATSCRGGDMWARYSASRCCRSRLGTPLARRWAMLASGAVDLAQQWPPGDDDRVAALLDHVQPTDGQTANDGRGGLPTEVLRRASGDA